MIIALDGPAGSGKSTIAKRLSQRLNIEYIDSGAIYRTLTLFGMRQFGGDCSGREREIAAFFKRHPQYLEIAYRNHSQKMVLQGMEVSEEIRTPEVTKQVKHIADNLECRELVNAILRNLACQYSFAIDGRDIGTVVFPHASCKFYLDAELKIRAARRAKEFHLPEGGEAYRRLLQDMRKRDAEDKAREIGPLAIAEDAIVIDTSDLDIDQVVNRMLKELEKIDLRTPI